jgi:anaerobic magnesium-protoporphyrin IX monomethyl ester cyclase
MISMKILFVEPPKEYWFVMGEYLPPPFSLVQLASYLERADKDMHISILDCQAQGIGWEHLEERIVAFDPDIVAASSLATCNAYTTIRTLDIAKKAKPTVFTVTGGQHFTALAQESLQTYPSIDAIVRGEGEVTFAELVLAITKGQDLATIEGLSHRTGGKIRHNASRPLIENLDSLPLPSYHFVEDNLSKYHFSMMGGKDTRYMIIEGSRGCQYDCSFCSQWPFWGKQWRAKSPKRIADEIEYCYSKFGGTFFWLTDDNFNLARGKELSNEIIRRGLSEKIRWFAQARCDDVAANGDVVAEMRKAGCYWMLLGVESGDSSTLQDFRKHEGRAEAKEAFKVLKKNGIFGQGTFIVGSRKDTAKSIADLRDYASDLDPDLAIFMILTPFPGTVLYEEAERQGWIEDHNWANYDMIHAVMPTETLSRIEVQKELYETYRYHYGSMPRRIKGIFSTNGTKRRTFRYLAGQNLLSELRNFFQ